MLTLYIRKTLTKLVTEFLSSSFYIKSASSLASLPVQVEHSKNSARMAQASLQGVLNSRIIPFHLHRSWPYWVHQQTDPTQPSFTHSGFPALLLNTTERNWTLLSSPGTDDKVSVDPRGLITPYPLGWSLDFWISQDNQLILPATLPEVNQIMVNHKVVIQTGYIYNQIAVVSEAFFKPEPDHNHSLLFNKVTLINESDQVKDFSFYFAIRPFNPEGISPIQDITFLSSNAFVVDNRLALILDQKPDNVICLHFEDGDAAEQFNTWQMILKTKCQHHLGSAFAQFRVTLQPGESKAFSCKLPTHAASRLKALFNKTLPLPQAQLLTHQVHHIQAIQYEEAKLQVNSDWEALFKSYAQFSLPDKQIETLILQNMAHLHSFINRKPLAVSQFNDKTSTIHDMTYLIIALNRMGAFDMSKKILKSSRFRQKTRVYPYLRGDRTGQLLVAIYDTYQFSQDIGFIQSQFSQVERLVKKIKDHGQNWTNTSHVAFELKNFISRQTGHEVYFFDYFWAIAGLRAATAIAKALKKEEALAYQQLYREFQGYLDMLLRDALGPVPKTDFIPVSTKREADAGLMMSLVSIYPLHVLEPDDPRINETLKILAPYMAADLLIYNPIGTPGFSISQNCQLAQIALMKHDERALEFLQWISQQALPTGAFPEAVHPISGGGSAGEGHSLMSTAMVYLLIRNFLIQETDTSIRLFPSIPLDWLSEEGLFCEQIPTHFGKISISLKKVGQEAHISIELDNPQGLKSIDLYLPMPLSTLVKSLAPVSQKLIINLTQ